MYFLEAGTAPRHPYILTQGLISSGKRTMLSLEELCMCKKNIGVILAGGIGARLSSTQKKQYLEIAGKECIAHVIEAYQEAKKLDGIIVVVNKEQYDSGYIADKYGLECTCGGDTRNASIYNGLCYIHTHYPECEKVILHDGARPFIRGDILDDYIDLLDSHVCVINGSDITDGIGKKMNEEVKREDYYISQTPEGFQFKPFFAAFRPDLPIVALSHHLPKDVSIAHYKKFPYNLKLTYPEDVFVADCLISAGFKDYMRSIKR